MEEVVEDYPRTLAELESRFSSEQACREYLFRLRWPGGFRCSRCDDAKAWPLRSVCALRVSDVGNGRNDFPGYADTANGLVSCHVVGDQSEERGQRLGATASLGPGKLPDSLGVATQTAAGYGEARTGSTLWEG